MIQKSQVAQAFTVHWTDSSSATMMQVVVRVDGRVMLRAAHRSERTGSFQFVQDQPGRQRPLYFAPLVLTGE